MTSLARALPLLLAALVLGACGADEPAPERPSAGGGWERLPEPPLGPREPAVALTLGDEALFLGGSDADPCPPAADCALPGKAPLRDGAAFDPATRTWTRLADAPVAFSFAYAATLGGDAYLLVPGERGRRGAPAAFLRYGRAADRWARLPLPPDPGRRWLVATGDRVVAYASTDAGPPLEDLVFDPATGAWTALPDDPLTGASGRTMAWSGRELVLFTTRPGDDGPPLLRAAAVDPQQGTWRRLPDSGMVGGGGGIWFAHEGRLILPVLGGADGGEVDGWGGTFPYGGILDPAAGRWSPLPPGPDGEGDFAAGVVAGDTARMDGSRGFVLDLDAGAWRAVPVLDGVESEVLGRRAAAAGRELVVFGGVRWDGARGMLLDEAWGWRIP